MPLARNEDELIDYAVRVHSKVLENLREIEDEIIYESIRHLAATPQDDFLLQRGEY